MFMIRNTDGLYWSVGVYAEFGDGWGRCGTVFNSFTEAMHTLRALDDWQPEWLVRVRFEGI